MQDDSTLSAPSLQLHMAEIHTYDVLLWRDVGGVAQLCLQGQTVGVVALMRELALQSEHSYGSKWNLTGNTVVKVLHVEDPPCLPAWWRYDSDTALLCLH